MAKMSLDELRKLRDTQKNELRKRDVEGKEIQIIVGMGTCGLAAGGREIMGTFLAEIDAKSWWTALWCARSAVWACAIRSRPSRSRFPGCRT